LCYDTLNSVEIYSRVPHLVQDFVGKNNFEEKRKLERSMDRCEDNIKADDEELKWEDAESIHLAQDRDQWLVLVILIMNI
jgi:hypothetical protein